MVVWYPGIWYMVYIVYLWLCRYYVCLEIMLIIAYYLSTLRRCPESYYCPYLSNFLHKIEVDVLAA